MKIRLTQPGFEAFTGQMGRMQFESGLSATDVEERDFMRVSAVMRCEREDGSTAAPIDALLSLANVGAPTPEQAREHELAISEAATAGVTATREEPEFVPTQVENSTFVTPSGYSEAELSQIADKEGIKGLRKIAEPMGIKGNSIKELIAEILQG